jgi:hypothetical protein
MSNGRIALGNAARSPREEARIRGLDIAPELEPSDVRVTIDGRPVEVLQLSRVREASGPGQYMFGSLIQVSWPERKPVADIFPVTVTITDRSTGEKGEGCLFYRPARLI